MCPDALSSEVALMGRASYSQARRAETTGRPTATLDEVDIRDELHTRARRSPNYEQEDRAYGELATEIAENPRNLLQEAGRSGR